jgi:hypothetical protein
MKAVGNFGAQNAIKNALCGTLTGRPTTICQFGMADATAKSIAGIFWIHMMMDMPMKIPLIGAKLPSSRPNHHQPTTIPNDIFSASLKAYYKNRFISYLRKIFSDEIVKRLISKYYIGTSKHWGGSTVFWQIDIQGKIRTGKVMLYDDKGHRVKEPFNHINWVHSLLYKEYNLQQCLFGEHLLTDDKTIPIAIVESEKTAIINSAYFPEFIWLAVGAKSNLKPKRCKALMGRRVVLYPDVGAYEDWQQKAKKLSYFCDIVVSDLLETHADEQAKQAGYDLADYLTAYDLSNFSDNDNLSS